MVRPTTGSNRRNYSRQDRQDRQGRKAGILNFRSRNLGFAVRLCDSARTFPSQRSATVVRLYCELIADQVFAISFSAPSNASRSVFRRAFSRAFSVVHGLERFVAVDVPSATP